MKRKIDGALNVMNSRFFEFESNLDHYKQQSSENSEQVQKYENRIGVLELKVE